MVGLPPGEAIDLAMAVRVIAEADRKRVMTAISFALQFDSGGIYDIVYSIIHPVSGTETIVRAKGKTQFDKHHTAVRFTGILENVTVEKSGRQSSTAGTAYPQYCSGSTHWHLRT